MPKASTLATSSPATVASLREVLGVDIIELAQTSGMIGYADKAAMDADLAHDAGALARVTNDATEANNGVYRKEGASGAGSWVQADDRVVTFKNDLASTASGKGAALVGFLQSGTGAVARTVQDKARERVSVMDFLSDAERADVMLASPVLDHTASVQKAANDLVARGGGVLEFPQNGILRVDRIAFTGTDAAWLNGVCLAGNGAKIIANDVDIAPNIGIVNVAYVDGLEITGLHIDGHREGKLAITGRRHHAINVGPAKNVYIHGNSLRNLGDGTPGTDIGGDALRTGLIDGLRFVNNHVQGWGRWVVACVDWGRNLEISNNVCQMFSTDPQKDYVLGFIDLEANASNSPIVGVSIVGNVVDYGVGIAASAHPETNTTFRRNYVIASNTLIGSLTDDRNTYMLGAYNYGVSIAKAENIVISGNNIVLGGDSGSIINVNTMDGLVCKDVVITGNMLTHYADGGVNVYADGCLISGNRITNALVGGSANCVYVRATSSNCHVIGNALINKGNSFPLIMDCAVSGTVSGNRLVSSARAQVFMNTGTHVFGNTGSQIQCVSVAGATDARIGPSVSDMYTNLVTTPADGQKAVLPYFVKQILQHSAAPTTGTWGRGDLVLNSNPSAGGNIGWACTAAGTPGTWTPFGIVAGVLSGSKTQDWPDLATATTQSTTVTVTGASVGDYAEASMSVALSGTRLWAEVTAADTVTVYQRNDTGAAVDLASGTLRVRVRKQ